MSVFDRLRSKPSKWHQLICFFETTENSKRAHGIINRFLTERRDTEAFVAVYEHSKYSFEERVTKLYKRFGEAAMPSAPGRKHPLDYFSVQGALAIEKYSKTMPKGESIEIMTKLDQTETEPLTRDLVDKCNALIIEGRVKE